MGWVISLLDLSVLRREGGVKIVGLIINHLSVSAGIKAIKWTFNFWVLFSNTFIKS